MNPFRLGTGLGVIVGDSCHDPSIHSLDLCNVGVFNL